MHTCPSEQKPARTNIEAGKEEQELPGKKVYLSPRRSGKGQSGKGRRRGRRSRSPARRKSSRHRRGRG